MTEKKAAYNASEYPQGYTTAGKPALTIAEIAANVRSLQAQLNAQGFGPRDLKAELTAARQRIKEMAQTQADSIRLVADQTRRIMELERENKALIKQSLERAAETHALRTQLQVYWFEIEELRAALLGLVAGLAALPENWVLQAEFKKIEPQIDVARDCLGRAGLLADDKAKG